MKSKDNNLEKNISRLVKLTGDSNQPSKAFADSLVDNALGKLKQPMRAQPDGGEERGRFVSFRKPAWIGAAAAVLVMGTLLLVSNLKKDGTPQYKFAKDTRGPIEEMKLERETAPKRTADIDKAVVRERSLLPTTKEDAGAGEGLGAIAADMAEVATMPEQPPFAPASAIELVTLPRRQKVQITIYNSADLTLVRERRNLTLKKGWNWLQFMWANTLIDPTSLSLQPLGQADKIDIQQLVFPARLKELGRWLIRSEVSGQVAFEITYFTSGLNWRAFYMGTLSNDEQKMRLQGYVRVTNKSGEDYENAQTRLIVGKVHIIDRIAELARRQYPYNRPGGPWDMMAGVGGKKDEKEGLERLYFDEESDLDELDRKEIRKEGLSEYFLYTIEGTETIPDKWGKRLMSFEAEDVPVKSLYKYDEERWGGQTIRFVAFANDAEHNLGDTPIPNGTVKIYGQADEQGYLSYIGGTNVKYIPVNEEIELNLGSAREVSVEPVLMNFKTDNYVFDNNDNIAGWDEIRKWKIEVTNARTLDIEIEITRGFGTAYWTLQGDDYEQYDATHVRFKVKLKPQSKRTFVYTVTTYHGEREELMTKAKKKQQ